MVHFLRDQKNNSIIETEVYNKTDEADYYTEISSSTYIGNYSLFLLSEKDPEKQYDIIKIIDTLDELRGWLWESYYMTGRNDGSKRADIEKKVGEFYNEAAERLGLRYVTD